MSLSFALRGQTPAASTQKAADATPAAKTKIGLWKDILSLESDDIGLSEDERDAQGFLSSLSEVIGRVPEVSRPVEDCMVLLSSL